MIAPAIVTKPHVSALGCRSDNGTCTIEHFRATIHTDSHGGSNRECRRPPWGLIATTLVKVAAISHALEATIAIVLHLPIQSVACVTGWNMIHGHDLVGADLW